MRVFLSFASEDRDRVAVIAQSIRAIGHDVFLDHDELGPGREFEQRIARAIADSALMVFMISPDSVRKGKFTLTELRIAQRKWPVPDGHVLPVMLRETPREAVPAYLRTVTSLQPDGDVAAEVAIAVRELAGSRVRKGVRSLIWAAATLSVLALITIAYWPPGAEPWLQLDAQPADQYRRGLFGNADEYGVRYEARRSDPGVESIGFTVEARPAGALYLDDGEYHALLAEVTFPQDGELAGELWVAVPNTTTDADWRLCAHAGAPSRSACSDWVQYQAVDAATQQMPELAIPDSLREEAVAVAWADEYFWLVTDDPPRAVRLAETGDVVYGAVLDGAPTSVSAGHLGVFVGLAPNRVLRLDRDTLVSEAELSINVPFDSDLEPVSARPAQMAQDHESLWVLTRGGEATNGLLTSTPSLSSAESLPYLDEVSFDLPGMTLRGGQTGVWSGANDVTPSSIWHLTRQHAVEYAGHDYELAECATDVLPTMSRLIVPDCDGRLFSVTWEGPHMRVGESLGVIPEYGSDGSSWSTVLMGATPEGRLVAATTLTFGGQAERTFIQVLGEDRFAETLLEVVGAGADQLAVGHTHAVAILRNNDGARDMIAPRLL